MEIRRNRVTERAGVNAARTFFESQEQVFQEIELSNDYGKDAYIDFTVNKNLLGTCAALQIKTGRSFIRSSGYAIPIEGHYQVWRDSSLPVIGIVYDNQQNKLYWVNISAHLDQHDGIPTSIPISANSELTPISLYSELLPSVRASKRTDPLGSALLQICSPKPEVQIAAISDCFVLGRTDARAMLAIRNSLRSFRDNAVKQAIAVLAHTVPHPDIAVVASNHVPDRVQRDLKSELTWTHEELVKLFLAAPWAEGWDRGSLGQCLYHLLITDPDYLNKVLATIPALTSIDIDAAFAALYIILYWSDNPKKVFASILHSNPLLEDHELIGEVEWLLDEYGGVPMG